MFKNIKTDEFMYPILGYDNYSISRGGRVGRCLRVAGNRDVYQEYSPVKSYFRHGELKVKLHKDDDSGKELSVAKLNLYSIYGELPFGVIYRDDDPTNVIQDNLYYDFCNWEITENLTVGEMEFHDKVLILSDKKNRCEVFKSIPDSYMYNNFRYWISSKGVIFDYDRKCLISRSNDNYGYYKVGLQIPGRMVDEKYYSSFRATVKVHQLVYVAWVSTDLDGLTIDHVDGRRHNNDAMNLEAVTLEENVRRAHDRNMYDEKVIRAKWSTAQVRLVCQMLQDERFYVEIAEALGVENATDKNSKGYRSVANLCASIRDGRCFQDIAKDYTIQNNTVTWKTDYKTPTKFDPEIVRKVCEGLVEGKGATELSRLYPEISSGTIQNIKLGKQYRDIADTVPGMEDVIASRDRHYLTYEEAEHIAKMLADGRTYKEIAISLGIENPCKANPAYQRLSKDIRKVIDGKVYCGLAKKYQLTRPDPWQMPREEAEYFARMISGGKSYSDIAGDLDISQDSPDYKTLRAKILKVIDGKVYPDLKEAYNLERIYHPSGRLLNQ